MKIMEMAQAIGIAIKASADGQRFEKAKQEYEQSDEIKQILEEYETKSKQMQDSSFTDDFDPQLLESINERLDALYVQLTNHPLFIEFESAQEDLNAVIKSVNATIVAQITGEIPRVCTHDCGTCGGCG